MGAEGLPKQALLDFAQGIGVSKDQFERWRKAGLLPRPKIKGLGRGRGTVSVYPSTAAQTLTAVKLARTRERRLRYIAFRLWLAGYRLEAGSVKLALLELPKKWMLTTKARNKRERAMRITAGVLEAGGARFPKSARNLPESTKAAALEGAALMGLGGSIEVGFHDASLAQCVFASNPELIPIFEETIREGANEHLFDFALMKSHVLSASESDLERLRRDLLLLVNGVGAQLGMHSVPKEPELILTQRIAAPFLAYVAVFIVHMRLMGVVHPESLAFQEDSGSNEL